MATYSGCSRIFMFRALTETLLNSQLTKLEYLETIRRYKETFLSCFINFFQIAERLVKSYELILGFFGIKLASQKTGRLERASNFEERYYFAFQNYKNNLEDTYLYIYLQVFVSIYC